MGEENDCKRYTEGKCVTGDVCVGKDACGAYEPKSLLNGNSSETDMRISVAHLREILSQCVEVGYINEYSKHRIIELVKNDI